jgi:hypothetical protein
VLKYFDADRRVLDGGECGIGIESTVIDMSRTPYQIMRQGALSEAQVFSALEKHDRARHNGGTAAAKRPALRVIESLGGLIIDCDEVYHELLQNDRRCGGAWRAFSRVWTESGVDRKSLGPSFF